MDDGYGGTERRTPIGDDVVRQLQMARLGFRRRKDDSPLLQSDLVELSAGAAIEAMRCGDIKAEAYASALLAKAKELEHLNAFITLAPDQVLEAAREADKQRGRGERLGLLHGLPLPVKDSVGTCDLPTSAGTRALRNFRPKDNAPLLNRLFGQGAILMGKTNLDELSYDFTSDNTVFGAVRNPYDVRRIPGGSSGGSAVAVAGRMSPMSIAEDTLGSIRIPATMSGVVGLRASYGRYPDEGVLPLTESKFDQLGALTRCVSDLSLFDAVATGDHTSAASSATPLAGVRIGISPEYFAAELHEDVARVWDEGLYRLKSAGATLVTAPIPQVALDAQPIAFTVIGYDTVPAMSAFLARQHTGISFDQMLREASPKLRKEMQAHALAPNRPSSQDYEHMLVKRQQLRTAMRAYFADQNIAALAFPPVLISPPRIGDEGEVLLGGKKQPFYVAMAHNVALGSCASLPGLVLPAGLTPDGLPVGIEFDGPEGSDRALLSLGLSLEKALGPIRPPTI